MKKFTMFLFACLTPMIILAHEVPVPHAHQEGVHGLLPFLQYIVSPIVLSVVGFKLYKSYKQSDQY